MREKEKAQCKGHFFHHRHYLENPNGGCVPKYVSSILFKFHDDPTVNETGIIILLKQVWVYARKRESFEGERRGNEWGQEKA